jgi:hypothetical protein
MVYTIIRHKDKKEKGTFRGIMKEYSTLDGEMREKEMGCFWCFMEIYAIIRGILIK